MKLAEPATWSKFARGSITFAPNCPISSENSNRGKRIIGYGSVRQGQHAAQHLRLGTSELDYIIDNTPFKQNKVTPFHRCPSLSRSIAARPAELRIVARLENLHRKYFAANRNIQKRGGRFRHANPEPKIVSYPA